MLFAVLVLNSGVAENGTIFETAAFVILVSIIVHGLTDTVGARWIEHRMKGDEEPSDEADSGLASDSGVMP